MFKRQPFEHFISHDNWGVEVDGKKIKIELLYNVSTNKIKTQ